MTNMPDPPLHGSVHTGPVPPDMSGAPDAFSHTRSRRMSARSEVTRAGVGMGTALAITISWSVHKSILWAIVHGFLSWLYVAYYALTR